MSKWILHTVKATVMIDVRGALRDSGPRGCEGDYKTVRYCAIQQ